MAAEKQNILKGYYQYSQINNFVSVKNFMFVRSNGENHLLIRFSNDSQYSFDYLAFTILQLDSSGNVLGKIKATLKSIDFLPGSTYASDEAIVVHNECSDFKLTFSEVRSGNYRYRVRKGKIYTYYSKDDSSDDNAKKIGRAHTFSAKPQRFGKPGLTLFLAICVLFSTIFFNAYHMFSIYYEDVLEKRAEEEAAESYSADTYESERTEQ